MTRTTIVEYEVPLAADPDVAMLVEFTTQRGEVVDYAVVLTIALARTHTVRLYDGAHGVNDMHRYTRTRGKHPPTAFHPGTLGQGLRYAIAQVERNYLLYIQSWRLN